MIAQLGRFTPGWNPSVAFTMQGMITRRTMAALGLALPGWAQLPVHRAEHNSAAKPDSLEIMEVAPDPADHRIAWGTGAQQFGELRLPSGIGPFPVIINLHGGFWRAQYDLRHAGHLCAALKRKGVATWNVEYRRIGQEGGGYPGTLQDAVAGCRHITQLASRFPLDLRRVVVMGHSAGGHLALYAAPQLPPIRGVVALAPVADLRRAQELNLSRGVVRLLMGASPDEAGDRYREASPIERVPLKLPQILVHGTEDDVVPIEISRLYAAAARAAGDPAELVELAGAGHFELIDPRTREWIEIERLIFLLLGRGAERP